MARKFRHRISYVLDLPVEDSPGGHRLGVNGLAVDSEQSILYSGGRDGAICAWDLNIDLRPKDTTSDNPFDDPPAQNGTKTQNATTFKAQTQAHTHWINNIVLAKNNRALVSASSDLTVKVWRPLEAMAMEVKTKPETIGLHTDYVKCLASPGNGFNWVASGGLDKTICLWDLTGAGKQLEIQVGDEEASEKGSVYALSTRSNILAAGGPESIVRLWDARSGRRITKFVGHTDNVRDILINETGDMIMTASSDQTVKVWSLSAGRCMHTLTMHNDSVWSLFSEDPTLGIFYSSDRSGLVVKTDIRDTLGEIDDGISVAVAQENDGVNRVLVHGDHIWTATSSSSINRWASVDTGADVQLPEPYRRHHRTSSATSRPRQASTTSTVAPSLTNGHARKEIPAKSILRISNRARYPLATVRDSDSVADLVIGRQGSEILDPDLGLIVPIHSLPEETVEGRLGLLKYKNLNDRRRVLTLDTAGEVLLWDLLKCVVIKSFGKRHLEDVEPEVNTMEAIAPWCSVDCRMGVLSVTLEEPNCFDAEMYADELQFEEPIGFKDDQRINLGKWILRDIFSKFVDEMIKRDEIIRAELNEEVRKINRARIPPSITIPPTTITGWDQQSFSATPRGNGNLYPTTPGMGIGVATPAPGNHLPAVTEDGSALEKPQSQISRSSADRQPDYFGNTGISSDSPKSAADKSGAVAASDNQDPPKSPATDPEKDKEGNGKDKDKEKSFGKKLMKGMTFGSKKLGRSASTNIDKPVMVDEKEKGADEASTSGESGDKSVDKEKEVDDNLNGVLQKIRIDYDRALMENPMQEVQSGITPSLPNETPVLRIAGNTWIIIQEGTHGGHKDVYWGDVGSVGEDADFVAESAPMWLGEFLLRNKIPQKEAIKVSFTLNPYMDILPSIGGPDGGTGNRLNANRMLRVKKVLAYVAERIETVDERGDAEDDHGKEWKPEDWLELLCCDQVLPITMSLASIRAYLWKAPGDVVLHYRSNGRRAIRYERPGGMDDDGGGVDGNWDAGAGREVVGDGGRDVQREGGGGGGRDGGRNGEREVVGGVPVAVKSEAGMI